MKTILVFLIRFYQDYISILLSHMIGSRTLCRYTPSCSQYAKEAILQKGVIIGVYRSICRILSCQPYFKKPYAKSL